MAFLIDATMKGYKVLGVQTGTSKKGKVFKAVTLFRDGRTAEVTVTNPELFDAVDHLHEMDVVNLDVRAVAGREHSYLSLLAAPLLVVGSDEIDC